MVDIVRASTSDWIPWLTVGAQRLNTKSPPLGRAFASRWILRLAIRTQRLNTYRIFGRAFTSRRIARLAAGAQRFDTDRGVWRTAAGFGIARFSVGTQRLYANWILCGISDPRSCYILTSILFMDWLETHSARPTQRWLWEPQRPHWRTKWQQAQSMKPSL